MVVVSTGYWVDGRLVVEGGWQGSEGAGVVIKFWLGRWEEGRTGGGEGGCALEL